MDAIDVGKRLKRLRERAGWSQQQLANLVNDLTGAHWVQSTVQKIEYGKRSLFVADLEALSEVFGLDYAVLLHGDWMDYDNSDDEAAAIARYQDHARLQAPLVLRQRELAWEEEILLERLNAVRSERRRLDAELERE